MAVDRTGVWALLSQGSLVQIDAGTNRAKRPIPVASHASGIAVAGGSVWVSDNLEGAVYQVDPLSHQVHTINLQGGADSIAADSTGVWVLDSASGTVVRIDPSSRDIGDPIRVGEKPSGIAVGAGSVWVADPGEGSVWRINAITGEPTSFPVGSDTHPGAVSVGEDGVWTTVESTQP